jgi:sodium/proline symporter
MAYQARMLMGEELLTQGLQKTVFIAMARTLFPAAISGLLLAAIMAASVSTADSQLLVASSSFTADIYDPIIRKKQASDKEVLLVGRVAVIVIAIIALMIASSKGAGAQAIMNLVENAWGIFGAAFGPTMILSYFWRRFNYAGACAGVICGAAVDIFWYFNCTATGIYELLPGFIAGLLAAVIVAKITKEPSKAVTDIFDEATRADNDQ